MKIFFRLILAILILGIIGIIAEFIYNIPSHSFNAFRYHTLYGGGERCLKTLSEFTNDFVPLGTFEKGHCRVKNRVRISSYKNTKLSGDLTLSCPTAVKVGQYFDEIKASYVGHMGTYNCRRIANSKIMSEHSYGTAIDISNIDGASVEHDWNKVRKGKEGTAAKVHWPIDAHHRHLKCDCDGKAGQRECKRHPR